MIRLEAMLQTKKMCRKSGTTGRLARENNTHGKSEYQQDDRNPECEDPQEM
jgi:hypothetical protein